MSESTLHNEPDRPVAVVTGASSGMGQASAVLLAAAGFRVFGASRRAPVAEQASKTEHVTVDVCAQDSVRAGIGEILHETGRIDLLVNCAGYLAAGAIEDLSVDEAKAQFETNYFGVLRSTLAVLPGMREQRSGHIVTVSSLAGLVPVPFWGHYNASKFAVEGLMETLRHEVHPFGIQVALVEPGNIKTPFYARQQAVGLDAYAGPRARAFAAMDGYGRKAPGPEVVARKIVAIATDRHPALRNKVTKEAAQFTLLKRLLPARAFEAGIRRGFNLTEQRS
jgi:NAD(P)-dependent dehydrogenase (short-subunit alcohol dehydrogenase family)